MLSHCLFYHIRKGIIIDDLDARNFNEHQLPNLLVVNPFNGLDREIAEKAIQILLSTL